MVKNAPIFKTTNQTKISNTVHNLITFSFVFKNKNRGGIIPPPPLNKYKGKKHPIKSKVKIPINLFHCQILERKMWENVFPALIDIFSLLIISHTSKAEKSQFKAKKNKIKCLTHMSMVIFPFL